MLLYLVVGSMLKFTVLCFALVVASAVAKHEVYKGWKAYSVFPKTKEEQVKLIELSSILEVDFIKHAIVGRDGVGIVKPQYQTDYIAELEKNGIEYAVYSDDVQKTLEIEDQINEAHRNISKARNGGKVLPYDAYVELNTIYDYLIEIAEKYPDIVTLVNAGNSFEGRPIYYLKISKTNFEVPTKQVIFVDSTIHAREWAAPPAATYAIHKLVEDLDDSALLDEADWIILPMVNPDGYEWSFNDFRLWRKTRSIYGIISGICPGVDGNRNYDINWNTVGVGATNCADNYAGPRAFSEPETQVVRDILLEYVDRMALYITLHSYGSMILYPWGDTGLLSENAVNIHRVGAAMGRAIDAHTDPSWPTYAVGNSVPVVGYPASGGSMDYAHAIGVPLAYTYELPGFGFSFIGFHPDPSRLGQIVTDTWEGISTGARLAIATYRRSSGNINY